MKRGGQGARQAPPPERKGNMGGRKRKDNLDMERLFNEEAHDVEDRRAGVIGQRTKSIKSGPMLEVECYPIWDKEVGKKAERRLERDKGKYTRENRKRAHKMLTRLINANFDERDLYITLTYEDKKQPQTLEAARRDIKNYISRVRRYRKRMGIDDLKYIYVTECKESASGKKKYHHHMVMGGMDRDEAEELWGKGHANTRRLQSEKAQFAALAAYMIKSPAKREGKEAPLSDYMKAAGKNERKWCCSRGLKRPTETTSDHKISRRQAERMAMDTDVTKGIAREILTKKYRGYEFVDIEAKTSPYVPGIYIYARMRRRSQSMEGD
jgi:hypothetical protein